MTGKLSTDLQELVVAKLISEKVTRKNIASKLGVSNARLSQLLKNNPHLSEPLFSPSLVKYQKHLLREMDDFLKKASLIETLSALSTLVNGVKVSVIYDRDPNEMGRPTFSRQTARVITEILKTSGLVGVCGGLTIKPQTRSTEYFDTRYHRSKKGALRFIPLCGLSHMEAEATRYSATLVAIRYHEIFNAHLFNTGSTPPNLSCLTMYSRYDEENATIGDELIEEGAMRYIEEYFPGYREIFGYPDHDSPEAGLIEITDTMITGIGASNHKRYSYLDPNSKGYISFPRETGLVDISIDELKKDVICGDIGGVLLPRVASNESGRSASIVRFLNSRLTTLKAHHLKSCAENADDSVSNDTTQHSNGVVCIAFGAHKAEAVIQSVKLGFTNHLIIDPGLAQALENF